MRSVVVIALIVVVAGCSGEPSVQYLPKGQWVDLSHSFASNTIYWPTADQFKHETVFEGFTDKGFYYAAYNFSAAEHGGTHVDAPIHFAKGRKTVDELAVDQLIGIAAVIDVADAARVNRDYQVTAGDFEVWETDHGELPDGCIILLHTGSSGFWPDRVKYMGTAQRGEDAVAELHFPGLHPEAAKWLVENRAIKAIGLDTPSIDYGQSTHFESHQILFDKNIPALENVAHLDRLPPLGAIVFALPMKIEGGSGGPARIVALIPD